MAGVRARGQEELRRDLDSGVLLSLNGVATVDLGNEDNAVESCKLLVEEDSLRRKAGEQRRRC
jgi:hypothetical protein